MAAMASLSAVAASTSFAPSVSISFSGLRAGRALVPAAAFPHLRQGTRPRSMPLRIRAEAEGKPAEKKQAEAKPAAVTQAEGKQAGGNKTFVDVQKIIAEQLAVGTEKIKIDSEFAELGADSLDTVEIMMALEEKFDIQLDADKGESIKTVKDVVGLIEDTVAGGKKA